MKLQDLLEQTIVGKETFENIKSSDKIISCVDKDLNVLLTSKRLMQLKEGLTEDLDTISLIDKAAYLFEEIENKLFNNKTITPVGYRIKLVSLCESYNKLVMKFENKKYLNIIDKDKFARVLGTMQYSISKIAEDACSDYTLKDIPLILEDTAQSELEMIESIVE